MHGFIGGMHGFIWGGMHGFIWGACMVLFGGAWFYLGGMHGFIWGGVHGLFGGACVVLFGGVRGFFSFFGYSEIWSMSGQYTSYWNAFLLTLYRNLDITKASLCCRIDSKLQFSGSYVKIS